MPSVTYKRTHRVSVNEGFDGSANLEALEYAGNSMHKYRLIWLRLKKIWYCLP